MAEEYVLTEEVRGSRPNDKVLAELVSGQKTLAQELQRQQTTLKQQVEHQRQVLDNQQQTLNKLLEALAPRPKSNVCYGCGEEGHFRRDCPKAAAGRGSTQPRQQKKQALNSRTPPQ